VKEEKINLKEKFKEGDWVVFSEGFERREASDFHGFILLPSGYCGRVKKVEEEYVQVAILHPLADIYIQVCVYSPEYKNSNDPKRTDSLSVIRKKKT
jgi:hypothetical protein